MLQSCVISLHLLQQQPVVFELLTNLGKFLHLCVDAQRAQRVFEPAKLHTALHNDGYSCSGMPIASSTTVTYTHYENEV